MYVYQKMAISLVLFSTLSGMQENDIPLLPVIPKETYSKLLKTFHSNCKNDLDEGFETQVTEQLNQLNRSFEQDTVEGFSEQISKTRKFFQQTYATLKSTAESTTLDHYTVLLEELTEGVEMQKRADISRINNSNKRRYVLASSGVLMFSGLASTLLGIAFFPLMICIHSPIGICASATAAVTGAGCTVGTGCVIHNVDSIVNDPVAIQNHKLAQLPEAFKLQEMSE